MYVPIELYFKINTKRIRKIYISLVSLKPFPQF